MIKSIGEYVFPYKSVIESPIINRVSGIFRAKTEKLAVKDMLNKLTNFPSHMTSHTKRKNELINLFRDTYEEQYPEVFI